MSSAERDRDFTEYFVSRAPVLRRTAFVIVRDWHTAEDVTQRAFVKLYAAWPRVSEVGRDAYARRIVVNESLDQLRRKRPEVLVDTVTDTVTDTAADRADGAGDPGLDLVAALAPLTPQQRAVVALRFLHDLSVRETAEQLGVAEGTVKAHTSRALDTLRRHLPDLVTTSPEGEPRD